MTDKYELKLDDKPSGVRPTFKVEGPLASRQEVKTAWGGAWAEEGCFILENMESGDKHICSPNDFELQYQPAPELP